MRRRFAAAAALALLASALAPLSAHEIPRSVAVNMFVKADGRRLHVLIRVPLAAMRDIEFPLRDGFLDVPNSDVALLDGVGQWILPDLRIFENGRPLGRPTAVRARASLPSDRSFVSFEQATAHILGPPIAADVRLPWDQAMLDAWLEYPIASDRSAFSISPGFARLGVDVVTAVRFISADRTRAFELRGDPGLVRLDPSWYQAAWQFVRLGFAHILDGIDHLLFLACLVIPLRRLRPLLLVVTSFTVAHSITLIGSAAGFAPDGLWFPPLVEVLIAASILYMAIENVVAAPSTMRRCAMAFGFGLVHGFGFSFALKETLQFAGGHLLGSLVAFNIGVELGQLLVLALLVPALQLLFKWVVTEKAGTIVLSILVGHTAWHWMAERWASLRSFDGPSLETSPLMVVRAVLVLLSLITAGWLLRLVTARRSAGLAVVPTEQQRDLSGS
jgi:hypothetical protein